jgi:hypothetical protein
MKRAISESSESSINSSIKRRTFWDFELKQPNFIREESGFFGLGFTIPELEEWVLVGRISNNFFEIDPSLGELSQAFREAGIVCPLTEELEVPISKSIGDLIDLGFANSSSIKSEEEEVKVN